LRTLYSINVTRFNDFVKNLLTLTGSVLAKMGSESQWSAEWKDWRALGCDHQMGLCFPPALPLLSEI